jgi:Rhs element Vgr protein
MPTPTFAFNVTAADGTGTAFTVSELEGEELISQPFEYRLTLRHADANLDFSKVVNQAAVLTMSQEAKGTPPVPTAVKIAGVVASFRITRQFDDGDVECEATLVPKLWRLRMFHGSRVFQGLSVLEIVDRVFAQPIGGAAALTKTDDYEFRLDDETRYPKREFVMQYRETALDFVQRLLEHEGIYYYFDDGKLILSDHRSQEPDVEGKRAVHFGEATGSLTPADDQIYRFIFAEQVVPGDVVLRDYDFEAFKDYKVFPDPSASTAPSSSGSYARVGTYYEHGRFAVDDRGWTGTKAEDPQGQPADSNASPTPSQEAEGRRQAQMERIAAVRAEELEAQREVGEGQSTASRLQAGHVFALENHFRFDDAYLVTGVRHRFRPPPTGATPDAMYWNEFTCINAMTQFRPPRRTPVPRVPGVITAKVDGVNANDGSAKVDAEGRYRVTFPFDPDPENGQGVSEPSRPLRLAQPYAGKDYGIHFPNRADAEMVIACLDGDPDRPLGLSVVPTPWTHAPTPNKQHDLGSQNPTTGSADTGDDKTTFESVKNVIRTQRGHQLIMDDGDASANVGITLQAGKSENERSTGSIVDTYWGSKIELGGYRHLSALERVLGIASAAVGYFRNVFSRDFPGMAGDALGAIASQVTTDDHIDDAYGSTTPVGVNIYTNKNVNVTGKDGVNITSPNLFGMFSTSLMPGDDAGKHQYWAEAISKFMINTIWQDFMNDTADDLLDIEAKAKKYKANKFKNPKAIAALTWEKNVKKKRISSLFFTLLQRSGVNISSMGELKMASLQSTSVSAGQGGLNLKSSGGITQEAELDVNIEAHQGIKISSKGVPYKGSGVIELLDRLADKVLPMKALVGMIQTKFSNLTLDPNARFKIELENEEGDIFLHTGTGDDKGGDIMAHVQGNGQLKAFVNDGQLHAWSGKSGVQGGILMEVGSRDGLGESEALKPLNQSKVGSRITQTDKLVDVFGKEQVQLRTVDFAQGDAVIKLVKGDQIELKCGQSSLILKKDGTITLKGKAINLEGSKDVKMEGGNITSKASMNNKIDGSNVKLKATLDATVEGGVTMNAKGKMTTIKGSLLKAGS